MAITISLPVPDIIIRKLRDLGFNKAQIQDIYKTYTIQCTQDNQIDETIDRNFGEFVDNNKRELFNDYPQLYEAGGFAGYE
jgi:hypothetical protein